MKNQITQNPNVRYQAFGPARWLSDNRLDSGDSRNVVIGLPRGSSNSTGRGRINMSTFLALANVCPIGYEPESRNYFPKLPDVPNINFMVLRPQDMPVLAASGKLDAFLAVEDVVAEAQEAGICGIEKVLELPFAEVDVVMVVKQEARCSALEDLLCIPGHIHCVSELPLLAKKCFFEENLYKERFGDHPPLIEHYPANIVDRCPRVTITVSAGSSEPQVRSDFYHCAVTVKSTGRTINECQLNVIKVIGTFYPGFFCRAGMRNNSILHWFIQRLTLAQQKWMEMQKCHQLELSFVDA